MAKENNEINDIVKKCKILLLDIEGTTTSISFVKDKLFPYVEQNVKGFLESLWDDNDVKAAVTALRQQVAEDEEKTVAGLVAIPGEDAVKDEQIDGLVKNVQWQMSEDRKAGPLKQLQGLIWKQGYDKGDIKGHLYDDVYPALELWRATEGQKVYIYSSGSVQAQKLLFNKSLAGNLLPLIDGHFDTAVGAKLEAASYANIAEQIGCEAEEILFLTDIVNEAEAARAAGLQAVLVSREGNAPLPAEATASFPVIHSFEQLTLTNKRKPDPQVEEVPAKVPKTDAQGDVKTTSETEAETTKANGGCDTDAMETAAVEKSAEPETMEVEETPDVKVAENQAEVADITVKDVPMDEAVAAPAVTEPIPPIEIVAKAESKEIVQEAEVDNATTIETPADKEASVSEAMDVKADTSDGVKVECPQAEPKVEEAVKTGDKTETKVKMVDAATLTEVKVTANTSKAVQTPTLDKIDAYESKTVDASTETAAIEGPIEKPSSESPIEEPKKVENPVATPEETSVVEQIPAEAPADDAINAPAKEMKDETGKALASNTENLKATADIAELNKIEADTAVPTAVNTATSDVKTEKSSAIESEIVECIVGETSEAKQKEAANGTNAKATAVASNDSDASEVAGSTTDKVPTVVDTDSLLNGAEKAVDKPEEMAVEAVVDEVIAQKNADAPVVEEMEKTEPKETEKMETEATVSAEKIETATEPKEPAENTQEDAAKEAIFSTIEIKDITDDKESLAEATDDVDDVVPIVEEPSQLEEMEKLQNAGDVLEKECDEILSKVQDATNLGYIPVKPLHTIAEEMETDNIDSNDMVERILDSEMELSMKPDDIDLNTVQEIAEPKMDTDERIGKVDPGTEKPSETPKIEALTEEKMEVNEDIEMEAEIPNDNKAEPEVDIGGAKTVTVESTDEKMETGVEAKIDSEKKIEAEESAKQEMKLDTEAPIVAEPAAKADEAGAKPENNESDKASVEVVQDTKETSGSPDVKLDDAAEMKVNGKTNGNIEKLNGNASKDDDKDDDLKSRLTAENVKEKVNGSNGDSADSENGKGDNKVGGEIPDIKVKTVTDEHTPVEQPVEA